MWQASLYPSSGKRHWAAAPVETAARSNARSAIKDPRGTEGRPTTGCDFSAGDNLLFIAFSMRSILRVRFLATRAAMPF